MLVWSTEFPANSTKSVEALLQLAKKWKVGSPHSTWKAEIFKEHEPGGEIIRYSNNGETFDFACVTKENRKWGGARHKWTEAGKRTWTTEIAGYQSKDGLLVSIQLHCELLKVGHHLPLPKKPYLIKQILNELGGGVDDIFSVSDTPIVLNETDLSIAEQIVNGQRKNQLPIIYVSVGWDGSPEVNCINLARQSAGMAHVVVEPSREFSHTLGRNTNGNNAYGGAVSIYWPNSGGSQVRLLPDRFEDSRHFESEISELIRKALTNNHPTNICTWDYVEDLVSQDKIEKLKSSEVSGVNAWATAFDEEITTKNARIAKAESELAYLRSELQRHMTAGEVGKVGVLAFGTEQPLYPGEIKDIVVKALHIAKNQVVFNGRSRHVLDDLLLKNPKSTEDDRIEEEVKKLSSASDLGRGERRILETLGFQITDDGKHTKASFRGDSRYLFTISKTSSDHRAMRNLVSDICRTLFK